MRKSRIFYAALVGLFLYLGLRLSPGLGLPVWIFILWMFLGVLVYPTRWLRKSELGSAQHLWRWKSYLDMGLLCFLSSLVILRDLLLVPVVWFRPELERTLFGPESSLMVMGLALVVLAVGVWNARSGPRIKKVKVPIRDLPESLEGYRIAQISDLHVGPTIGANYVRRVVRKVNSLDPQLTVLTGDIIDGDADHHLEAASHLSRLEPAGRILYVTGNHEFYWDGPRWIEEFRRMGLRVLLNSREIIRHRSESILVAGILDPAAALAAPGSGPDLKRALGGESDSSRVKILLAHQPDIAFEAADAGFDLMISGHTHAGQFFPFTLLIHSVQKFVKGLKACGRMWVYVNQGTGYWGPPIRLGTVTEITLLELTARRQIAH